MGNIPLVRSIAAGVPIGISFVTAVGYVAQVHGTSMQPVLNPDSSSTDYVILNKWSTRDYQVNRGDVVCLTSPRNPDSCLIKRVIALEGDVVQTKGWETSFVKIPQGHCWVEGDNSAQSMDSNFFGPVPVGLIIAKAAFVVWPPGRFGRLSSVASLANDI